MFNTFNNILVKIKYVTLFHCFEGRLFLTSLEVGLLLYFDDILIIMALS